MKFSLVFAIVFCLSVTSSQEITRKKRTIFPLIQSIFRYSFCGTRSCPPWKCQDDSAVIHGYCCNCPGSEYDNVPIPCSPTLKCPPPASLCADYDFMMNCCCTGP